MNTPSTNSRSQEPAAESGSSPSSRREFALRPPVDVFEDSDGITLWADMPGVARDRLTLRVDGTTLLLEGDIQFPIGGEMQALYADVRSNRYQSTFVLSNELDTARIEASLKDGVLSVRIPKRSELRPRRIEVRTA
jgi:HSP20 family protein